MAGPATNQKIEVLQGVDAHETFLFFDPPASGSKDPTARVPRDFSGATARLMVKPTADGSATSLLSLTIGAGLSWVSGTTTPGPAVPSYSNGIAIWVTRAQSLAANAGKPISAYYDLLVDWPTGETSCLARGTFNLVGTASRVGPSPTISSVTPDNGTHLGGTSVAIVGTGYVSGCVVSVDGGTPVAATFTSSTHIAFVTRAHAAGGPYTLRVTNPDGGFVDSALAYQFT